MELVFAVLTILLIAVVSKMWKTPLILHDFSLERTLPLRGILALLIVMHHLARTISLGHDNAFIKQFNEWGSLVVGLFFFITGYGLMVSYRRKGEKYLVGFVRHRLIKLLPPFLITMFGWMAFIYISTGENTLLWFSKMLYGETPLPNSWFIYAILLFYIFFYIVARIVKSPLRSIWFLWLISSLYIIAMHHTNWGTFWYSTTFSLNVGYTYAYCENTIKVKISKRPWTILLAFITLLFLLIFVIWKDYHWMGLIIRWFMPICVVFCIYVLGMVQTRLLNFLGNISYEIYLVHGCFISYFYDLQKEYIAIFIIVVYVCSIFTAWIIHKICGGLTRILT